MWNRRVAALATAVLLGASACGSGSGDADTAVEGDDSGSTEEYVHESPLGDFLGWTEVNFDAEDSQAEYEEQERQVQEAIAACMREQGFEYKPVDHSSFAVFDEEELAEEEQWGSEAWTRKYGFGITTQRYSQAQVGPDLVGHNYDAFGPGADWEDPNQEYTESLTPEEQEAYYEALYGGGNEPEWDWMLEEREPTEEEIQEMDDFYMNEYEPTGCEPVAYEETFNAGPGGVDQEVYLDFEEEFSDVLEEMYERIEASPEVVAHRAEVEACVTGKGFDYLVEDEMYMYFEAKLEEAGLGWNDPLEGVDTSGWTDEQFEQAYRDAETQQLAPEKLDALTELQQEEIEMALAVLECNGGWENESKIFDEVRIELEQQFLDENMDRLAEYEGVFGDE